MSVSAKVSGTWQTITQAYARVSGLWKPVDVYVRIAGVWTLVSSTPLSATVSAAGISATASAPGPAVTGDLTAAGHDGSGSYTYAWEYVSGDAAIAGVNTGSAAAHWLRTSGSAGTFSAQWRCKVSDASGFVYAPTVTITITITP